MTSIIGDRFYGAPLRNWGTHRKRDKKTLGFFFGYVLIPHRLLRCWRLL